MNFRQMRSKRSVIVSIVSIMGILRVLSLMMMIEYTQTKKGMKVRLLMKIKHILAHLEKRVRSIKEWRKKTYHRPNHFNR